MVLRINDEPGKSNFYLSKKAAVAKAGDASKNSGCMRGNDTYDNNGSASIGISPVYEEIAMPDRSYNDFIQHNYGQPSERQYAAVKLVSEM